MYDANHPDSPNRLSAWQRLQTAVARNTDTPATSEQLAIVGIGCRLPGGANDWPSFWNLLDSGQDAITETPADRWSTTKFYRPGSASPGKLLSRWGGHVTDIQAFDPRAFGISPREAAMMDPQQRMLLEVAWRAIEDAGRSPRQLAGDAVGVFVGISSFDHAVASLSFQDRGVITPYSNTGGSSSIAANRISYSFDLRGPSLAIDTACSSSLLAVHLACESIRRGESAMALAGGVNALLMPDFTVAFSQLGVLSPDGRCKTFDARANGYVRSEGAGMVLIRPLRDALAAGDLIYAVIRATASNQDGRTAGLTVPNGEAQQQLIREACRQAAIEPTAISYVEAHGTGTPVGDPIEANAIGSVIGAGRPADRPCLIGSVKTNIGHLEAAAGIASVIKVALSLQHRRIPAHLHFQQANPAIDFDRLGLRVPTATCDWPGTDHAGDPQPRLAAINGFGYGGANAHVILEEPPAPPLLPPDARRSPTASGVGRSSSASVVDREPASEWVSEPLLIPVAARDQRSLAATADRLAAWLDDASTTGGAAISLSEIAAFLAHRRSGGLSRAAFVARDHADLITQLRDAATSLANGQASDRRTDLHADQIAFVFSGQGPQWWAMGRRLFASSGVFRRVIEECAAEFSRYGNWSLVEELLRDESSSRMKLTRFAQPAIFAVQTGIAAVWKHWGIEPAACVGHSVGEIAAAYVAGGLSFKQACQVAFHRGRTMDLASSQGAMLAVGLSRDELADWVADDEQAIAIAAVNGPTSLTLSGAAEAIEHLAGRFEAAGIFCRRLTVEYAFHSSLMEPVREELLRSLADLIPQQTTVPLFSTVTGRLLDGPQLTADYWWQNVRQPVLFADAMACLASRGTHMAIEIGPHPVLAYAINECFQAAGQTIETLPSLHREKDDVDSMLGSLGRLSTRGLPIDWSRLHPRPQQRLPVPPEPFQTKYLRDESREARLSREGRSLHPLLGERADGPEARWQGRIDLRLQTYLQDHRVRGACVHPAAAFLEAALAAARDLAGDATGAIRLERLTLKQACIHDEASARWMECRYRPDRRSLSFADRGTDDSDWTELASLTIASETAAPAPLTTSLASARDRCDEVFVADRLYHYCDRLGLEYGEQFRGITRGRRRQGECVAAVHLPDATAAEAGDYIIHPALLDACFHGMIAADRDFDHTISGLYLPHTIAEIRAAGSPGATATVHVCISDRSDDRIVADIDIYEAETDRLCLSIRGFVSHRVTGSGPAETTADLVYRLDWVEQDAIPAAPPTAATRWLLFGTADETTDQLMALLVEAGDEVVCVRPGNRFSQEADGTFVLNPNDRAGFTSLLEAIDPGTIGGIVGLWSLDAPGTSSLSATALDASTHLTCRAPLHLVQAWEAAGPTSQTPCFLVTAQAQTTDPAAEAVDVSQAPLIGMGRVITSEFNRLRTRLVDLPADSRPALAELVQELRRDDGEDEVLLRRGRRWVRRFHPHATNTACPAATASLPARLEVGDSAGVEDLHHRLVQLPALGPHDIEIEVRAAGLNFSDVMKVLSLYPGLPPGRPVLGSECSGIVSRVGAAVTGWKPGDEVMAVAPGAFGTHVVVATDLVARKPRNLSHQQAAALPIAFLTAIHALETCGRMRADDTVLIHAASGGVGLAAIQLARLAGARVLATAGNDEKRAFVREQGADAVMNSRSLAFADEVRRLSGGVDIILNSLPGEAIPRGIEALAVGGRFLEIGKRDIYGDAALGLYAFRNNIAFFGIDLDQLFKQQPRRMGELLRTLPERFESGELQPLPITVQPATEAVTTFRSMQQARHIGKLVIDYTTPPAPIRPATTGTLACDPDGSYWVAGGLGGFGLEVARWLASRGAGTLILGGRSLQVSAEAAAMIGELEAAGTRVRLLPADITKPEEVRRVLKTISTEERPLRGIFHTAMVLEDRLLVDLDHATLDRVLRPKVLGGWNLHQESLACGLDLEQFVVFSSLSSVFGHAGQANYAAANAALDGLAHHRHHLGLPATVINWGHLGEVGYLARRDELSKRLERQGVLSFTVQQAMACLGYAIASREIQLSVLRMDWSRWRGLGITDNVPPKFAHLLQARSHESGSTQAVTITPETIRTAAAPVRRTMVETVVCDKAVGLLGIDPEQLERERPLLELGLDSLMAVELRNWIENRTGISLAISALMRSTGVTELVDMLCGTLADTGSPEIVQADASGSDAPASDSPHETPAAREFPLSAGQRGLWAAARRNPADTAYNVFLPTRVRSQLDVAALRQTMHLVVDRHATLRTTFSDAGGRLLQQVHDSLPPRFTVVDATGLSEAEVQARAAADAHLPFDLERGPLLRVTAFKLAEDDWVVQATTHHIAVDFWSLILLLQEIAVGYRQLAAGMAADLPPATNNYAAFVDRQHRLLEAEPRKRLQTFWQQTLAGIPTVFDLPTDRPRPRHFTGHAASEPMTLSAATSAAVTRLATTAGVTPSAVLLAAVEVLLARLSGQTAFLIGMPFSGRSEQRFENTVGFFVNMLPIPVRLEDDPSFRTLVERTGQIILGALEHEDYPLAAIIADTPHARDPSRNPLFQVSCTFEKAHRREEAGRAGFLFPDRAEAVDFAGLRQESFHVPQQACVHDIEFVFEQTESSCRGMIHYATALFDQATIACLARNLETLTSELLAAAEQPLSELPWATSSELVVDAAAGTAAHGTVSDQLAPAVTEASDRSAVIAGETTWHYRDLVNLAQSLHQQLAATGLPVGSLVPVFGTGGEAVVATVATMLAGYAPTPVDQRQPAVGSDDLLADTAARCMVMAGISNDDSPAAEGLHLIRLDELTNPPTEHALPHLATTDLAYCIYTSGSTGRPKGVLIEQGAIANLLAWRQQQIPLAATDRVMLLFSHQFDAALGVTLATLQAAATLVLADTEAGRDIDALIDQVIRDEITVLPVTPSLLQLLARHPRFSECVSLRQIWCGGEAMPADLPRQIGRLPEVTLWNLYGPTETTVEAAVWPVPRSHDGLRRIPLGTAAAGATLLILDENQRPLPDGVPGELAIAGPGLARGYLGRPELTAARFITLQSSQGPLRAYLTGDRCRRRPDGCIEFLDRLDDQVKLRGYRIELGEVEACLAAHPSVAEAAVTVVDPGTPEARLAGFVVVTAQTDATTALATLRQHLAAHLPGIKRPATLTLLDQLPRTSSGKIDRTRLAAERPTTVEATAPLAPRTPLEEHLVSRWQETLGLDGIGINQNFFDIGGTSLQAAMLTAKLSEDLGVHVPTVLLFDLADISQIAQRLGDLHPAAVAARFGDASLAPAAPVTSATDYHPLIVPLKPTGSLPPLFLVHPPGGIVVCYAALAQQFDPARPLLGIRSRGLHGEEALPASLESMAADYASALRSVQPVGPYLLGGWSLGGVIASEVARQLIAEGDQVERLILFDSSLPGANGSDQSTGREYGLDISLEALGNLPASEQLPFLYDHARQLGLIEATAPEALVSQVLADLQRLFSHHVHLCNQCTAQPLDTDGVLFRPQEVPVDVSGPDDRGWGQVLRSVEVSKVPGHHHSMVALSHASTLAAAIRDALEAAVMS